MPEHQGREDWPDYHQSIQGHLGTGQGLKKDGRAWIESIATILKFTRRLGRRSC